jgi:hypothetical protein
MELSSRVEVGAEWLIALRPEKMQKNKKKKQYIHVFFKVWHRRGTDCVDVDDYSEEKKNGTKNIQLNNKSGTWSSFVYENYSFMKQQYSVTQNKSCIYPSLLILFTLC